MSHDKGLTTEFERDKTTTSLQSEGTCSGWMDELLNHTKRTWHDVLQNKATSGEYAEAAAEVTLGAVALGYIGKFAFTSFSGKTLAALDESSSLAPDPSRFLARTGEKLEALPPERPPLLRLNTPKLEALSPRVEENISYKNILHGLNEQSALHPDSFRFLGRNSSLATNFSPLKQTLSVEELRMSSVSTHLPTD